MAGSVQDGGHTWWGVAGGACMAGGHSRQEGICDTGCIYILGACIVEDMHVGEMVTEADGMHPTGMHSCCFIKLLQ